MLVGLVLEFSQKQICQNLEKGKGTVMEKGRDGLVEMGKGTGGLVEMVVVEGKQPTRMYLGAGARTGPTESIKIFRRSETAGKFL